MLKMTRCCHAPHDVICNHCEPYIMIHHHSYEPTVQRQVPLNIRPPSATRWRWSWWTVSWQCYEMLVDQSMKSCRWTEMVVMQKPSTYSFQWWNYGTNTSRVKVKQNTYDPEGVNMQSRQRPSEPLDENIRLTKRTTQNQWNQSLKQWKWRDLQHFKYHIVGVYSIKSKRFRMRRERPIMHCIPSSHFPTGNVGGINPKSIMLQMAVTRQLTVQNVRCRISKFTAQRGGSDGVLQITPSCEHISRWKC